MAITGITAQSGVEICSMALTRLGANPITSFSQDTAEAIIANENYAAVRGQLLGSHHWSFATGTFTLSQVANGAIEPYDYAYQLPADLFRLIAVKKSGTPISYQRYDDKILCDEESPVDAHYTRAVAENYWPPYFVEAAVSRMEALFALGLLSKSTLHKSLMDIHHLRLREAKNDDAQGQSSKKLLKRAKIRGHR